MAEHYVIVGSGIAGVTAAEVLRSEDPTAGISVITDDPFPPYYRPALKDYLAGRVYENKLWSRPISFYQEQQIRLLMGHAVAIRVGQHVVELQDGQLVGYSRLLVACGARARRLSCPGTGLAGVMTLRSVADYQEVQKRLSQTRRIVVVGSGTLALETVETLRHRGYAVTHLLRRRTLWSEVLDQTASDLILQQERRDGVDLRVGEEIVEITGQNGQVAGVRTTSGVYIPCEIVIMAIGIEPNLDLLKKSGIPCGQGGQVDQAMRTVAPDIYAAGDILETVDSITGRTRLLGQWYPALQQARTVAYSMLGRLDISQPPSGLFYNATSLYGLDLATAGLTRPLENDPRYQEIIADPEPRVYRKVVLKDGIAVGVLMLGKRRGALACKRAIDHAVNLRPVIKHLFAEDFDLNIWLDQQGVPPVLLNISREGATAIREAISATSVMQGHSAGSALGGEAWLIAVTDIPSNVRTIARIQLSQTRIMAIGRQEGIYLLIDHVSVSRRHAEISYNNGEYMILDVGSSNGTFINDTRLDVKRVCTLRSGDIVRFGNVAYKFQMEVTKEQERAQSPRVRAYTTWIHEMATGFYKPNAILPIPAVSHQPILNESGDLLLPGANSPIPVAVVETFHRSPVLIAVQHGVPTILPLQSGASVTLGRGKTNNLILKDIAASRKHAEVISRHDGLYIRDLGSSNGVVVNQIRIDNPYRLTHGDQIQIGGVTIYFIDRAPALGQAGVVAGQKRGMYLEK